MLTTESLTVGYATRGHTATVIASDLTLSLAAGELVCVLGPNGAGKSTLLRTLSGLQAPLSGIVRLDGQSLHQISAPERARLVSVVLTDRIAGGMLTGYDVVSLGRVPHTDWRGVLGARDHEVIQRALSAVGADALATRYVAELSDGERQRIMMARALAQEPRVMILDEITAFLDLPRRVEVIRLLSNLAHRQGTAILLSTHDLDLALRSADRVWLVGGTGAVDCGAPEDLVLDGAFGRTFSTDGLVFNAEDGGFVNAASGRGAVAVMGEGLGARWTVRAVERAGFQAVPASPDIPVCVRAETGSGRSTWWVERDSGRTRCESLGAVVDELRRD